MTTPKKTAAPKAVEPTEPTATPTANAPKAADESVHKQGKAVDPELRPGYVVFYDAAVYGGEPAVHVGIVIHAAKGRVRVKQLGLAGDSADFPIADVRLSA
jgi:hypothetical protein